MYWKKVSSVNSSGAVPMLVRRGRLLQAAMITGDGRVSIGTFGSA
jgi:hypothetical protein